MDYGNLKVPENVTPEAQAILDRQKAEIKEIENAHRKNMAKLYGGAALQIGSAFIPGALGLKATGGAIKALTPYIGKKIAENVATGTISGLASGAVEGLGRGLMEGENPLKTMVSDATLGTLFGGAFGLAGGKIGKKLAEKKLQNGNIAPQKYFDDYVVGLKNPNRKDLQYYRSFNLNGELSNGNTQVLYDTPDDFIDLTNSFDSTPTMEEVKNFLRESAKTGKKFETSSPDYFLDVLDSSKKIDHIAKSSNFKTMNKSQKKRHNKYVLAFDDISKTLKKNGEGVENTKPDKKPNVKNYHEFNTTAKFNENNYPLTVYAEQLINEPDTIPQTYHLYDILENKKSPSANSLKSVNLGDDTNIITDNLDNINPSAGLYKKIVDNFDPEIEKLAKVENVLNDKIPITETEAFRNWFGNSKVVDENGNPKVVYHGSFNKFDIFDKSKQSPYSQYGGGFFFADDYNTAKMYGDNIYPVYLKAETDLRDAKKIGKSQRSHIR